MRIFITGGTGFIGRPVVKILSGDGHDILLLSRASEKHVDLKDKNVQFLEGELEHLDSFKEAVKKFSPEVVVHLAWEDIASYSTPENSIKNLELGLEFFLFAAGVAKKIVCVGSDQEYGTSTGKVDDETELRPANVFAATKVALHEIGKEIAKKNGAEFLWARIFHSYGSGQRPTALIPDMVRCLEEGKEPVMKNPKAAFDYIYVEDVARAIAKIVENRTESDTYNIASGYLTSVQDIASIIFDGKLPHDSLKDATGWYADMSKTKKELEWSPEVDIVEGVKKTADYYKKK